MTRIHWQKEGWDRLTSKSYDKTPLNFNLTKPYRKHDFKLILLYSLYVTPVLI